MNKLFTSVCIFALVAGLVACSDDSSSASSTSVSGEKAFTLEGGVVWQPSYGDRAWTGFNKSRTEENFLTLEGADGAWLTFSDSAEGGKSLVQLAFTESALTSQMTNVYHWEKNEGLGVYEPTPYPYSGFAFGLSSDGSPVDISAWKGLCIVYESTEAFYINPKSAGEQFYWRATVPASLEKSVFELEFSELKLVSWSNGAEVPLEDALKTAIGITFEFSSDLLSAEISDKKDACYAVEEPCEDFTAENTIRIYKIGLYGKCGE